MALIAYMLLPNLMAGSGGDDESVGGLRSLLQKMVCGKEAPLAAPFEQQGLGYLLRRHAP
jgi:hypothetical protein